MEDYCDHKTIEEVLEMKLNEPIGTYATPHKSGVLIEEIDDEGRAIEEPWTSTALTKKAFECWNSKPEKKKVVQV